MSKIHKNVVFIDNDINNWTNDMDLYDKTVDYIRVPNSTRDNEPKYTKYLAKNGNQYAAALLRTGSHNFVNRGIDKRVANQLKNWSSIQTNKQRYALFDWDGTISATEGFSIEALSRPMPFTSPMMDFLLPTFRGGKTKNQRKSANKKQKTRKMFAAKYQNPTLQEIVESQEYQTVQKQPLALPSKEFLDDMFVYLMRPDRVEMLRDLFQTLLSNGVQVHVFTHNPYASISNPYRKIFIEMMSRLFNQDSKNEYSGEYKTRSGNLVHIHESSSHYVSLVSKEDLDSMLHSTIDYTNPGEPANNRCAALASLSAQVVASARGVRGLSKRSEGEDPSGLRRENALKRNMFRGLGLDLFSGKTT
jgi:hypothetical protein